MNVLKALVNPRTVLGVSVVIAGIVVIMSPQATIWLRLVGVVEIAGGIALLPRRTASYGAIAVGAVYLFFSLESASRMIVKPDEWLQYVDIFERFSVVCGAIAIYVIVATPAWSAALTLVARIGLGVCTASFAWAQVVYLQHTASLVPAWIPPNPVFWTNLTTGLFALAAVAILINVRAKLAIDLMVVMLTLFGILVWIPLLVVHPQALVLWREIAGNYAITGAAWAVAQLRFSRS